MFTCLMNIFVVEVNINSVFEKRKKDIFKMVNTYFLHF